MKKIDVQLHKPTFDVECQTEEVEKKRASSLPPKSARVLQPVSINDQSENVSKIDYQDILSKREEVDQLREVLTKRDSEFEECKNRLNKALAQK